MFEQQGVFNREFYRLFKQCNLSFKWSILKKFYEFCFGVLEICYDIEDKVLFWIYLYGNVYVVFL